MSNGASATTIICDDTVGMNRITYPTGTTGRGVLYSSLNATEKALVKSAIEAWVNTQASDVATTLLSVYESDGSLNATYVGYGIGTGGTADFSSSLSGLASKHSYLRIDGPRVWVVFVVQQGVAFTTQVHYHTLWRDKTAFMERSSNDQEVDLPIRRWCNRALAHDPEPVP